MKYRLKRNNSRLKGQVQLESSKSESNRALLIHALAGGNTKNIHNLSMARDTQTMLKLLSQQPNVYDVKDAGTTMRFLTAYLAIVGNGEVITGTDRMKNRPIGPLVEALRLLGAEIQYLEKEGYPPLKIKGIKTQQSSEISIPGNISSQYISALLMIAPCLPQGLKLKLTTEVYSRPYIEMTLKLMKEFGAAARWNGNVIEIKNQDYVPTHYSIEGDWSGASYWYSMVSLAPAGSELFLPTLKEKSTQGDQAIATIMKHLGVHTRYVTDGVVISKLDQGLTDVPLTIDFRDCPDLAQTVMVAAAVQGVVLEMTGLESLKIKETDRIAAMQNELGNINASLNEENGKWILTPAKKVPNSVSIETYEDHRMAMAFAPLCNRMEVVIHDPKVVEKSYPSFWEAVEGLGIEIIRS